MMLVGDKGNWYGAYCAAKEKREELKQQRDELQRDAERLNWLESNPRHAQIVIDGKITDCVFYGISCAELVRLRDAIDAAIAKVKP